MANPMMQMLGQSVGKRMPNNPIAMIAECGFTLEEKTILNLRADGLSIIEIADWRHCSVETINRRIRSIKNKIADIVEG